MVSDFFTLQYITLLKFIVAVSGGLYRCNDITDVSGIPETGIPFSHFEIYCFIKKSMLILLSVFRV